jgi:hypothetical protein
VESRVQSRKKPIFAAQGNRIQLANRGSLLTI